MGITRTLIAGLQTRLHPSAENVTSYFATGYATSAGLDITEETALTSAVVFACARVLAEGLSTLPLTTYYRLGDGTKEEATDHPLYWILKLSPNTEQTSMELRETLVAHVAVWGNAYCEIEWTAGGQVRALWPLRPDRMTVTRENGNLFYYYDLDDSTVRLPRWRVLHVRGLGYGVVGMSPVKYMSASIGLDLATEEFGARFFGNGARPGMVLKHPGRLSKEAFDRLKDSWSAQHEGLSKAHRMRILEEGMDVAAIGVPPDEAQFLETRKFQRSVIAGWFRVPLHMIGDLERATFSNIEHQDIGFAKHTLTPWAVRVEQALQRDLLSAEERQRIYFRHNMGALMRGDAASRSAYYVAGVNAGYLTRNEVRELEDMNPLEGLDEPLVPLNMVQVGDEPAPAPAPAAPAAEEETEEEAEEATEEERSQAYGCTCATASTAQTLEWRAEPQAEDPTITYDGIRLSRQKLFRRNVRLFEDAGRRLVRREVNDLQRAVDKYLRKRSAIAFGDYLEEFYRELRVALPEYFRALMEMYAEQMAEAAAAELDREDSGLTDQLRTFVTDYLDQFAGSYVAANHNQLRALLDEATTQGVDPAPLVEERLAGWEETKPGKIGLQQAFEAGNALVVAAYGAYGVQRLRWLSRGESCPFCISLNGKVIGIDDHFLAADTNLTIDGAAMLVRHPKRHGPIHRGCDCVVVAA